MPKFEKQFYLIGLSFNHQILVSYISVSSLTFLKLLSFSLSPQKFCDVIPSHIYPFVRDMQFWCPVMASDQQKLPTQHLGNIDQLSPRVDIKDTVPRDTIISHKYVSPLNPIYCSFVTNGFCYLTQFLC